MLIKTLYVLFVLGMAALVAVGVGVLLRVKRHLNQTRTGTPAAADEEEAAKQPADDKAS